MESSLERLGRSGVLVLPPAGGDPGWRVLEVEADCVTDGLSARSDGDAFPTPARALHAAFDVLTLLGEGRIPAMHEHVQESVRDFVRTLEARGYDRESAVRLLLDMADRRASDPPKRSGSARVHQH